MTQRTDVGDRYPSVTASGMSHGKGSTGPRGEAETPKGMCMWASLPPSPGVCNTCAPTHTCTCVGACTTYMCERATCVHRTPYLHKSAHTCPAHRHAHNTLHAHRIECFPAVRAPSSPCPLQPHHQDLSASVSWAGTPAGADPSSHPPGLGGCPVSQARCPVSEHRSPTSWIPVNLTVTL